MKAESLPTAFPSARNVPDAVTPVCGLVLIGGQSTRMGQDKSALDYHGKLQREYLTDLLLPLCDTVYWSVNEMQNNTLNYGWMLLDTYPESGPLGGLLTAFDTNPTAAWFIVPCDLPNLNSGTLQTLLANRNANTLATAFWDTARTGPEPLVSIWEPAAGPLLRTWFQNGNRSPRRFMSMNPVTLIDVPDARVFENVNDWKAYKKVALRGGSEQQQV